MLILQLTNSLLLPTLVGGAIVYPLIRGSRLPQSNGLVLALSYELGLGLLSFWMLLLAIWGIPFSLFSIALPLVILAGIGGAYKRKSRDNLLSDDFPKPEMPSSTPESLSMSQHLIFNLLFAYIIYYCLFVCWRATSIPIFVWDGYATIATKAKIFFSQKGLVPLSTLPHPSYPLLVPLAETWVAINLGEWNDQWVKIIFPPFFLSFLTIHYYFLKRLASRLWALFGTALLVSSNFFVFFASVSYRDFALLSFNCTAMYLLILWGSRPGKGLLFLAGLCSGLMTFTKLEGAGYYGIHLLLFLVILIQSNHLTRKERVLAAKNYLVPGVAIFLTFLAYKFFIHAPDSGRFILFVPEDLGFRIKAVLQKFFIYLFEAGNWNIVWGLFCISLLRLNFIRRTKELLRSLSCLAAFFLLILAVGVFTPNFRSIGGIEACDVLPRILLHFFPLAVVLIILTNKEQPLPGAQKTGA